MADARVSGLWRHPVKSHGSEPVTAAEFSAGQTMPWDRVWAIAHEASRVEGPEIGWVPCVNFSRGAKSPGLMAIRARTDEAAGTITFIHPGAEPLTANPDDPQDAARLIAWVTPLASPDRARPVRVVRAKRNGMTDSAFPSVSILNRASLSALSKKVGQDLAEERFRGNIWLEGLEAWEEFALLGREIRIGDAVFLVRERITRCMATTANPSTGEIDADTLGALEASWRHRDFGVYAEVTKGGRVAVGDAAATV